LFGSSHAHFLIAHFLIAHCLLALCRLLPYHRKINAADSVDEIIQLPLDLCSCILVLRCVNAPVHAIHGNELLEQYEKLIVLLNRGPYTT
tara:strand:- start:632 stop:901 length:270 start_codon:yes stop_codon:yes gene_type:complete